MDAYRACRDQADGPSRCQAGNFTAYLATLTGLVSGAGVGLLVAAAGMVIPFFGKMLGGKDLTAVIVTCVLARALLGALLAEVYAYRSCRDQEARPAGPSTGGPGTVGGGIGVGTSGITKARVSPPRSDRPQGCAIKEYVRRSALRDGSAGAVDASEAAS